MKKNKPKKYTCHYCKNDVPEAYVDWQELTKGKLICRDCWFGLTKSK